MHYFKTDNKTYIIRVIKGEKVIEAIKSFCQKQSIANASFCAIGSVEDPVLAHYRVDTKKFTEKKLEGIFEVTGLIGNVGLFEGKPLVHAHITLSDEDMHAFGGHMMSATVSATLEIMLTDLGSKFSKKYDEEIGLKLWELPEEIK